MQLPTEWVMINHERVATLIDSGCSRSNISSDIITGLRLKPAINEVLTMSGEKVRCIYEREVKITLKVRQLFTVAWLRLARSSLAVALGEVLNTSELTRDDIKQGHEKHHLGLCHRCCRIDPAPIS